MEKMDKNISVDNYRDIVKDLIQIIVVNDYNSTVCADIIETLNVYLNSNIPVSECVEIYALISTLRIKGYPNLICQMLCDEIELKNTRISVLPSVQNDKEEKIELRNEYRKTEDENKARKFTPKNGNFILPKKGETGMIISKSLTPDGLTLVEKVIIDSEGYEVKILDKYVEYNEVIPSAEDAYNDLYESVKEYNNFLSEEKPNFDHECDKCNECDQQ